MAVVSKSGRNVKIEVAYAASTGEQVVVSFDILAGSTVEHAIRVSGILDRFPHIDLRADTVGIFGQRASLEDTVFNGDRIEIYRPLVVDPKQARRRRAGQTRKRKDKRR
jgi:putative ubiquitin-RnfH superfamily antitoxin RatB of RatAB toxin-antitoxin module